MMPPFLGDIRMKNPERDVGKLLSEVHEFEVWDGEKWLDPNAVENTVYSIEDTLLAMTFGPPMRQSDEAK